MITGKKETIPWERTNKNEHNILLLSNGKILHLKLPRAIAITLLCSAHASFLASLLSWFVAVFKDKLMWPREQKKCFSGSFCLKAQSRQLEKLLKETDAVQK